MAATGAAPFPLDDLDSARAALWTRLGRAVRDRRSPWHTPVVATTAADGAPKARVMVLRAADPEAGLFRLHTDLRTAKVEELAATPRAALLFYDSGAKLQLRVEGMARIETGTAAAAAAWAATRPFSRRCYSAPAAPGTESAGPTSGLPPELEGREPTLAESEAGRPNFAILLVEAARLEFLYLAVTGHRRGRFVRDAQGWTGSWLIP
jgi:pyridoxine/pyridoxamine 5'-phosphate oxidase